MGTDGGHMENGGSMTYGQRMEDGGRRISGWVSVFTVALAVAVFVPAAWAQTSPPELHLAGDHWTAWNPPPVEDGATGVYVIQEGDTLSGIAERQLGNASLWPQIWEQNQYILDAHWIYPGDPLIISGAGSAVAFQDGDGVMGDPLGAQGDGVDGSGDPFDSMIEEATDDPFDAQALGLSGGSSRDAPVALGHEADIYCSGYVGDVDEEFAHTIASSEYDHLSPHLDPARSRKDQGRGEFGVAFTEKYGLGLGDIVYLDSGRADGLSAGELLTAVSPKERLLHPLTKEVLGRVYAYQGRVRVLSAQQETAIAEIIQLCSPMTVGTGLKLFEPEPVPLRRITPLRPANFPAPEKELEGAATIIAAVDNLITGSQLVTLGMGHLVMIDRGDVHDVVPGDIYTVYRHNNPGYPPIVLGELGVLSVFEKTALARVLRSRYAIYLGDLLVIK